jgi:ABC-type uncharacterized transport system permease subunit
VKVWNPWRTGVIAVFVGLIVFVTHVTIALVCGVDASSICMCEVKAR